MYDVAENLRNMISIKSITDHVKYESTENDRSIVISTEVDRNTTEKLFVHNVFYLNII